MQPIPSTSTERAPLCVVTWAQRPDLVGRGPRAEDVWPEYNLHADVFDDWWGPLAEELPEYQFALYDEATDTVLAEAHTGPLAWSGDEAELPGGLDDALRRAVSGRRYGVAADTLCAFAAEVAPGTRGRGLAGQLLAGMREIAARQGLTRLIAPVRPSWKERYPLAAIEDYAGWRRRDGALLDPWMRLHERVGARVAVTSPRSMRITGTVAEWECWTDLAFPASGDYVFPQGLAPLAIDLEADVGVYWEPNVWMVHPDLD
jgi:GNAT superfamily N-acetyltransferase